MLARLDGADVCLQGSPNLSQMALTRAGERANLEVANLLIGAPGEFDGLLGMLNCEGAGKPESWGIAYQKPKTETLPGSPACHLLGGEWDGSHIVLDCTRPEHLAPPVGLVHDDQEVIVEVLRLDERRVWLSAPAALTEALGSPLPLAVSWQGEGQKRLRSNAIVLCVQPALHAARQYQPGGEHLQHFGALDLDDERLEALLLEMEKTLVIDRADVFRAAGKAAAAAASEDDEAQQTYALDDLDRETVLDHPRLRRYLFGRHDAAGEDGLAALLTSITSQFRGLGASQTPVFMPVEDPPLDDQTEEELIKEQRQRKERDAAVKRREWRLLKAFVRRFARGLTSAEFDEFVGPVVVSINYRLLLHFLTVLLSKSQNEPQYDPPWLAEQLSQILQWYWGDETVRGYFRSLDTVHRETIAEGLEDSAICAGTLVALAAGADVARQHDLTETLDRLAGVARRLVTNPPIAWPEEVVEEAMRASGVITARPPDSETDLEAELRLALDWESRAAFLRRQAERHLVEAHACNLSEHVLRHREGDRVVSGPVPVLKIEGVSEWTPATVNATLADFMRFRASSGYCVRLTTPEGGGAASLVYHVGKPGSCLLLDHGTRKQSQVEDVRPAERPWDDPLKNLFAKVA